jgi:hypothetical protein
MKRNPVKSWGGWSIGVRPSVAAGLPKAESLPGAWFIGIDSWVIQDGNYPNFQVGQASEFAVEFAAADELMAANGNSAARRLADDRYEVTARIAAVANEVQCHVLDIGGLMVYRAGVPGLDRFQQGQTIGGVVQLGVDPFAYFERLGLRNDMPPLIYHWTIVKVFRQGAPWVEVREHSHARDLSQWQWVEVDATDASNDSGGHADYLLECRLTQNEPMFPRKRR